MQNQTTQSPDLMTSRFLAIFPWIIEHEGTTYEQDPDDPGGATKYGIDARSHPGVDIRNLDLDTAQEIYWSEWKREECEVLSYPLGEIFFNCCVVSGYAEAREILSRSATPALFLDDHDHVYRMIAMRRPSSQKYLAGWLNRNNDLRQRFHIAQKVG